MKNTLLKFTLKILAVALIAAIVANVYLAFSMSHVYFVYSFGSNPDTLAINEAASQLQGVAAVYTPAQVKQASLQDKAWHPMPSHKPATR